MLDIGYAIPLPLSYLFQNMVWFVLGQLFSYKQINPKIKTSLFLVLLFACVFVFRAVFDISAESLDTVLTLLGVSASVGIVYAITRNRATVHGIWKYISKYMLQIYLLHTMLAAGIRAVLLRLGISNLFPHLLMGLVFSFIIPIFCAMAAEQSKVFNVFFFPIQSAKQYFSNKK